MAARTKTGKDAAASLLIHVAKFISRLDRNEVGGIINGQLELCVLPITSENKSAGYNSEQGGPDRIQEIVELLVAADDTDAGFQLVKSAKLTRNDLESIARSVDVLVSKQDTASRLEEKIVAALVSSRLNSKAVRGK